MLHSLHATQFLKQTCLTIALCWQAAIALAADPVTDAMQAANAPYRMALYKTNGTSQAEAQQALVQAQQAWDKLNTQVGVKPARRPMTATMPLPSQWPPFSQVYAKAMTEICSQRPQRPPTTPSRKRARSWPTCASATTWSYSATT
jgi:hypothetical protein